MFAVIIKLMVFRVNFVITAFLDLNINQIDIKTAFLYDFINQLVYVEIAKAIKLAVNYNIICKLLKALYGLKQSPYL